MLPELEEFRRQVDLLRSTSPMSARLTGDRVALRDLTLPELTQVLTTEAGHYFLMAAAGLNRSSLKQALADPEAQVAPPRQRKAYAIRARLPVDGSFESIAASATALRQGDLQRKARGQIEQLFPDRLDEEGVPLLMSPPRRVVPGVLIAGRKPDGVWPDPATGRPPEVYLEIKNIRRVADDIQKRLYELAEASMEMKLLYGRGALTGLGIADPRQVADPTTAAALRHQVAGLRPVVIGLLICPRALAERYRPGAEALIDRIFFQEEIEECIAFITAAIDAGR
jgi:hypothetical protein